MVAILGLHGLQALMLDGTTPWFKRFDGSDSGCGGVPRRCKGNWTIERD